MDTRLQQRLGAVARRIRAVHLGWTLAGIWFCAAFAGVVLTWLIRKHGTDSIASLVAWSWLGLTLASAVGAAMWLWLRPASMDELAVEIEKKFPNLNQRLSTAIGLRATEQNRLGFLQRNVVADAVRHDVCHGWVGLVPGSQIAMAWLANLPTLVLMACAGLALWQFPKLRSSMVPSALGAVGSVTSVQVQEPVVAPGDVEVERGTSLIITAAFAGKLPDGVSLSLLPSQGKTTTKSDGSETDEAREATKLEMRRSLSDPLFAAYVYNVAESADYRVVYDGSETRDFHIEVFDYPALVRADAVLKYPDYTKLEPKLVTDTRRVSAAEGTTLTWQLHLNKSVVEATLVSATGERTPLSPSESESNMVVAEFELLETVNWKLELVDADNRTNPVEVDLRAKVLENQGAGIKLLAGGDVAVSALEELTIAAEVKDDFAVHAVGIVYQLGGDEAVERSSDLSAPGAMTGKRAVVSEKIDFEALNAAPRDLLSYYFWAEDLGNDGEVRRVTSDMFFAEVRPFDEIFRQGAPAGSGQQASSQGQQPGGNEQTQELLELQKQIVIASWNVMRQSKSGKLLGRTGPDMILLAESQREALGLLEEKAAEVSEEQLKEFLRSARTNMESAEGSFYTAAESLAKEDLSIAMSKAQAAYQDLLRLQGNEFDVSQSQQSQSQQSGSGQSQSRQQQIEQLELDSEENRYENERLAQEETNEEQAALRQVVSRLRELAARQSDLNEQLRELEAALQMAEDEEEQEELQAQLERLREQQQQLLQDSDELQEQMQSMPSEAMQSSQEQMENARENLQQANQALQEGNTSQALSTGTRAENELKRLQDQVRQQAANQFSETMQDMRSQAAELEKRQEEIVEQVNSEANEGPSAGLRNETADAGETGEQLKQQQEELSQLLNQMRETVEQSEDAEPLLAQSLYDTYRRSLQDKSLERIQVTERLLDRNLQSQAQGLARESLEDLETLRAGIDEAAEAVLGSELDSLKLALNQLERLTEELDEEIQGATGTGAMAENPQDSAADARQPVDPQDPPAPGRSPTQGDGQTADGEQDSNSSSPSSSGGSPPSEDDARESQSADSAAPNSPPTNGQPQDGQPGERQPGSGQSGGAESQAEQPRESQQPSSQPSSQPGQGNTESNTTTSNSQESSSQSTSPPARPGLRGGSSDPARSGNPSSGTPTGPGNQTAGGPRTAEQPAARPISGDGFREWSDALRDVEELVSDSELRWEATQIRQAARDIRSEIKKHAADPQWSEVEDLVATPLRELRRKVADELLRRAGERTQIVPIDRDPVPAEFSRSVREYYENLGSDR